jgi:hypothetical protein
MLVKVTVEIIIPANGLEHAQSLVEGQLNNTHLKGNYEFTRVDVLTEAWK